MRRSNLAYSVFLGVFFALAPSFAPAQGAFIATETSTVSTLANNTFLYSYTVNVAANSTVSASEFDTSLVGAINPDSIIAPSNFAAFYTVGDPFIAFTAFDDGTAFNGISPGSSGTFSFISQFAPVTGTYQIVGLDSSSSGVVTLSGSALVPGVPEPSSLLMCGLGVSGALGWFARSRRRLAV